MYLSCRLLCPSFVVWCSSAPLHEPKGKLYIFFHLAVIKKDIVPLSPFHINEQKLHTSLFFYKVHTKTAVLTIKYIYTFDQQYNICAKDQHDESMKLWPTRHQATGGWSISLFTWAASLDLVAGSDLDIIYTLMMPRLLMGDIVLKTESHKRLYSLQHLLLVLPHLLQDFVSRTVREKTGRRCWLVFISLYTTLSLTFLLIGLLLASI